MLHVLSTRTKLDWDSIFSNLFVLTLGKFFGKFLGFVMIYHLTQSDDTICGRWIRVKNKNKTK